MTTDKSDQEPTGIDEDPAAEPGSGTEGDAPAHPWEAELEVYPLRPEGEDPRWAVRTVWTWTGIALFSLAFILALLVLGFFYD
jgi:hypothetical protein